MSLLLARIAQAHRGGSAPSIRGLVALYKLDEASGIVAYDVSGNGNNGTYIGGSVTHGQASLLPSGSGNGTRFGSQSYMALPNGILSTTGRPFTIFGWGKSSNAAAAQGQQIMCSDTGGFNFYLYQSKMYGGISGISNNIIDSRTVTSSTTHFWALAVDSSGTAIIYDNAVASSPVASAFSSSARFSNAVVVGNYSGDDTHNYFQGPLQNVGVCNVALTQAEISAIYSSS